MALKVMIVDDEKDIHDYLKKVIEWQQRDLILSCDAMDSVSAGEQFNLHQPQIVFMDVCIPDYEGKNGLDLAREFCTADPDVRVIIITGYADFEYAREALEAGAIDLLLKPLHPNEIARSLDKAAAYFEEKRNLLLSQTAARNLIYDNIDLLRERMIVGLLENSENNSSDQIAEQFRLLSLNLLNEQYAVVRMKMCLQDDRTENIRTCQDVLRQMTYQMLQRNGYKCFLCFPSDNRAVCVISWSMEHGNERLEELMNKLAYDISICFPMQLKVGIGDTIADLRNLGASAVCAGKCLECEEIQGSETVFNYNNFKNHPEAKENGIVLLAKKYVRENLTRTSLGFDDVCSYIGITKIYFGRLFQKEVHMSFGSYINQERVTMAKSVLEQSNLRVSEVAEQVGFTNPKYFSVVFKSLTGLTPLDYRRSKRIN